MNIKGFIKDILSIFVTSFVIVFILIKFIVMPCVVDGSSMYPTLKDKQFGYSFVICKTLGINRFDIVVLSNDKTDKLLVKRVIGMPNETIEYKNNELYINGVLTEETFLSDEVLTNDFKVTLSDDEYYCLGDNRGNSLDSRFYGSFSYDDIRSSKIFIMYPFNEAGLK